MKTPAPGTSDPCELPLYDGNSTQAATAAVRAQRPPVTAAAARGRHRRMARADRTDRDHRVAGRGTAGGGARGRRQGADRGAFPGPDRLDAPQAGQGRRRRRHRRDPAGRWSRSSSQPIQALFGLDPNAFHQDLIDPTLAPQGRLGGMSLATTRSASTRSYGRDIVRPHPRGLLGLAAGRLRRDVLSVVIGAVLGVVAGFFGGWVDALISRADGHLPGLPAAALRHRHLAPSLQDGAFGLNGLPLRIACSIFVIGFFNWPYIGRIVRGQTLSLREREFVEAVPQLGARGAVHPVQGAAAQPGRADPRLLDAAHPDQHPLRGGACASSASASSRRSASWGGMLSGRGRRTTRSTRST